MSVKEVRDAASKLRSSLGLGPKNNLDPIFSEELGDAPTRKPKMMKKKAGEMVDLPDKYALLCKFFDSLDSSLRLLRLKNYMPSLKNITPQIECLTDRRFGISHLAQLKFILPEVIELKKVLVRDEKTFCMKPDLHVTLNVGAINYDKDRKDATGKPDMKNIFRSRVLEFVKAHPEEEVPEGSLPEPFNRSSINLVIGSEKASSSTLPDETSNEAVLEQPATAASLLPHSFQKRFSKQFTSQSLAEFAAKPITQVVPNSQASVPFPHLPQNQVKQMEYVQSKISSPGGTPSKVTSTPGKLMNATPALPPPKRCYMTPDADSMNSPDKLVRRPHRSRSLKFDTPVKSAKVEVEAKGSAGDLSSDDDIFEILPKSLVQSIREKELKIQEENDPAISQAKRRQQMIANLPKLFDMIRYAFQSSKRCLITKEELLHKLMTTHLDIIDRKEIEEQLVLLKELVPDLIYEKLASTGDLLIGINKITSPDLIHARLVGANEKGLVEEESDNIKLFKE